VGIRLRYVLTLAFVLAGGLGCQRHPLADGLPAKIDCSSCHGGPDNAAPPLAVNGATSTDDIGVGAHQSHLNPPSPDPISAPLACSECHVVPATLNDDQHPNLIPGPATMAFGPLAKSAGAKPAWDRGSATCTNTYCHGSTLAGSTTPVPPVWTTVDNSQTNCFSCHGDWPDLLGASHPFHVAYTCDTCHARVVVAGMMTIRNPSLHIDGKIDVSMATGTWDPVATSCAKMPSACHSPGSIRW
jgi:predicted CxxxxCH...CXXCH cytochrome family protein